MATIEHPRPADALSPRWRRHPGALPGEDYEAMLRIIGERRIFVNYDCGIMEVMVPSLPHERVADFLGLMIDILCEELDIACEAGGSTTHRRPDLEKGIEPDRCYWLRDKAPVMVGRRNLDLTSDPAPSLAIEVNYTHSSVDRMAIYAALGVDEVWRYDESLQLQFFTLRGDRAYVSTNLSRNFPMLTAAEATRLLDTSRSMERVAWMRWFRQFVRVEWAHRLHGRPPGGAEQS